MQVHRGSEKRAGRAAVSPSTARGPAPRQPTTSAASQPPSMAADAPRHNLPAHLTSFIGRQREIAELARLLSTNRLVTLTGAGGIGKTRLALQLAAEMLEVFPDGAWLVELAALTDPALVTTATASALGIREELGCPLLETLSNHLRPKRLLLVLDNCEHLIAEVAALTDTLLHASPHLYVLATSRQVTGICGESAWRVPSLSLPAPQQPPRGEQLRDSEAVRLLLERASRRQPGLRADA
jgi:predicted ATPase